MREGWKCPHCGKAHGPHVDTCPGGGTGGIDGGQGQSVEGQHHVGGCVDLDIEAVEAHSKTIAALDARRATMSAAA